MPPKRKPFLDRFMPKVEVRHPDECWPWLGAKTSAGYGHILRGGAGNGNVLAHRAMYLLIIRPAPDDMALDHTCHNADLDCPGGSTCPHRACVNPFHLEEVTRGENVMRGHGIAPRNRDRTHCGRGHELAGENLTWNAKGHRVCRACVVLKVERRRERAQTAAALSS